MRVEAIKAVPTNIVTGALGAGKTTLITALLANKPASEKWAILVNEFGEVGIDGAILSAATATKSLVPSKVFVREIAGGCMCCTSGLSMQIALNQLLAVSKPDRLIIEPTGLGHPKEVLDTLSAQHYQSVLDMRATLTLIDPRKLREERWRTHSTFKEQLQIADTIVATKSDLASASDHVLLQDYLSSLELADKQVVNAQNGEIDIQLLAPRSGFMPKQSDVSSFQAPVGEAINTSKLIANGNKIIKVSNDNDGYYSFGWILPKQWKCLFEDIMSTVLALKVERLKAVVATDKGAHSFNLLNQELSCSSVNYALDSRVEIIAADKAEAEAAANLLEKLYERSIEG